MRKSEAPTDLVIRNPKTGAFVTVRGAGALKDRLTLRDDIDLTKPIAEQVLSGAKS